ncbi:MAG: DUF2304 domain-containing protein [Bryobacteraceae bacterium]|nr:DUF2304 domain-containing protein [Bryobacteraceae bacterium]MDW8379178.1 DUF2304 domain-containing protein [Bryobacterales bacterium]
MDRLSNALSLFSLGLFVLVLSSLRRAHIRVEYSVSWLGAAAVLFVVSRSPSLMRWLADALGIDDPPLALLATCMAVFLFVFYRFSVMVSNLKDANIALTQRLAILEFYLRSQNEGNKS